MTRDLVTAAAQLQPAHGRLETNPAAVYISSLSPGSRRTMRGALNKIAHIAAGDGIDALSFPWHQLRYEHTAAIRAELASHYAHTTTNKKLSALRGVLRAAWRLGLMTADEYQTAAAVRNVTGHTLPAGRMLIRDELAALLTSCDKTTNGRRDRAILTVLYICGLRRAEVVNLDLSDYDVAVASFTVRGKRNKQRSVPLADAAKPALEGWLKVRGVNPGPLFLSVGNRNRGGRLSTQAIYQIVQLRANLAGITAVSPHDMRRTFVSTLLDAEGVDIVTVQKLAGHSNIQTTARYDRRGEQAKRSAVEQLQLPI